MRESTASSTIFKLVLAFTLLFAGFISLAIVYNRAYRLKNGSLAIIEKYEGNIENSVKIMNNYLRNSGYKTMGNCDNNEYGVMSLDKNDIELANSKTKYYYCLSQTCSQKTCKIGNKNQIYYNLKLFFKFDLPFIGEIFTYKVTGQTKSINLYVENQKLK